MQPSGYNPYQPQPPQQPYNPYAPTAYQNPYAPAVAPPFGYMEVAGEHVLAERGTRFAAKLVDGVSFAVPLLVGGLMLATGVDALMATGFAIGCLGWLAIVVYNWYLIATRGQSIGKRWLGIRIVKTDGSPCGFVHGVLLRQWVMGVLNGIVGITAFVDPLMIFGEERRCLHDHLASTKVVVATDDY